ncbi:hypothetical protein ANO11243_014020 [Dothideomycetidae sp. 11243]|nr:hypothetical protein ANO11243_014020 [fungal sp. No.11243]
MASAPAGVNTNATTIIAGKQQQQQQYSVFTDSERSSAQSPAVPPPRIWLTRHWRLPRIVLGLFIFELAPTIAALALYGIADPNLYRTRLWRDGFMNGFNSSPGQVLLSYANHVPFHVPLVWSQFITTFNLVISILSMFFLLVKSVAFIMHIWYPVVSAVIHAGLFAIYLFSACAQLGSDKSDPQHLQNGPPWYITKSCSVAYYPSNRGYCRQAKASLAVAIIMALLFFTQLVLAVLSAIPSPTERRLRAEKDSDDRRGLHHPRAAGQRGQTPLRAAPVQQKSSFVAAHPLRSNRPETMGNMF